MNIRDDFFMQTLFQISSKSNLNIDNLPSLGALLYQAAQLSPSKLISKPQFVQIGQKFCSLPAADASLLFDLYSSITKQQEANPRFLTAFLFAALFKATVSSKRQKILSSDLWPQAQQTFESMLEQYVKTCSDLLCVSLCVIDQKTEIGALRTDQYTSEAMQMLFEMPKVEPQLALQLSALVAQQAQCQLKQPEPTEQLTGSCLTLQNLQKRAVVYSFNKPVDVKIYGCSQLVVYLLHPVQNITVSACKHVKIFAPAVGGCLSIQNSRTLNVSACARFLKVYHSDDLQLNVSALQSCVQDSQLQTIFGAPFNLIYNSLQQDLEACQLQSLLSEYTQYRVVGPLGLESKEVVQNQSDFVTQVVPFDPGTKFIVRIPELFRGYLTKRMERLRQFQSKMEALQGDEKLALEAEVKGQLQGWVQAKGLQGEAGWICQAEVKVV